MLKMLKIKFRFYVFSELKKIIIINHKKYISSSEIDIVFNALKTVISDHRNVGFQYIKPTGVSNYIYSFKYSLLKYVLVFFSSRFTQHLESICLVRGV